MFSLPYLVYLTLLVVGMALLVGRKYAAAARTDGAPAGGSDSNAVRIEGSMTILGILLVVAAAVFGLPTLAREIESLLDALLGVAAR